LRLVLAKGRAKMVKAVVAAVIKIQQTIGCGTLIIPKGMWNVASGDKVMMLAISNQAGGNAVSRPALA